MAGDTLSTIIRLLNADEPEILSSAVDYLVTILSDPAVYQAPEPTLHKFRVRISSLLKSKSASARLVGCKLAQASCRSHWDTLAAHGATWAQLLVHIINTPAANPVPNQRAAIESLRTIISLTYGKAELTRLIATPIIPTYLKALLAHSIKSPALHNDVILSFVVVLDEHSTTARPNSGAFHDFLKSVFLTACEKGAASCSASLELAAQGFVSLHKAAAKGSEALEWKSALSAIISDVKIQAKGSFNLASLEGEFQGVGLSNVSSNMLLNFQRLDVLFTILDAFFTTSTKVPVTVPLTDLVDLFRTLLAPPGDLMLGYDLLVRERVIGCISDLMEIVGPSFVSCVDDILLDFAEMSKSLTSETLALKILEVSTKIFGTLLKSVPKSLHGPVTMLTQKALELVELPQYTATCKGADYTQKPHLFIRKRDITEKKIINEYLVEVITAFPDLPLPLRAKIDCHFLLEGYSSGIETSAAYPGTSTKYSILPMAVSKIPYSMVLDVLTHPRLPLSQGPSDREVASFNSAAAPVLASASETEYQSAVVYEQKSTHIGLTATEKHQESEFSKPALEQEDMEMDNSESTEPTANTNSIMMNKVDIPDHVLDFRSNGSAATTETPATSLVTSAVIEKAVVVEEEEEEDLGSDMEIPEIELGDSDED